MVRLRCGGRSIREQVDLTANVTGRGQNESRRFHGARFKARWPHFSLIADRQEAELSRAIYLRTDNQRTHVTCYAPAWHTDRCHRQRRAGSFEDKRDDDISFVGMNNK